MTSTVSTMEFDMRNRNFIIQLQDGQMDLQPKFYVAIDSDSNGQLESSEFVFLDGTFEHVDDDDDDGDASNNGPHCCDGDGEEVDLSQTNDNIHMEFASDIDDIDEPFKDSDGVLYYICDQCTFVCVDRPTLLQHSNENHPKQRPYRPNTNNSALRMRNSGNHSNDLIHGNHFNAEQVTPSNSSSSLISLSPPSPSQSPSPSSPPPALLSSFDETKLYECEICHKRLSTKANLRGHITIHSNDKPYACNLCPKSFKQKRHLKYHQKIHQSKRLSIETDQLVYADRNYRLQFSDKSNPIVEEPKKTVQSNVRGDKIPFVLFQCNQCPKAFSHKSNLKRHQRIHSPTYDCEICHKQFKREHNLFQHMFIHTEQYDGEQ